MNKSRQPKSTKYGLASSTWTGTHTWDSEPCWLVNYRIYLMEDLRLSNYKKNQQHNTWSFNWTSKGDFNLIFLAWNYSEYVY